MPALIRCHIGNTIFTYIDNNMLLCADLVNKGGDVRGQQVTRDNEGKTETLKGLNLIIEDDILTKLIRPPDIA